MRRIVCLLLSSMHLDGGLCVAQLAEGSQLIACIFYPSCIVSQLIQVYHTGMSSMVYETLLKHGAPHYTALLMTSSRLHVPVAPLSILFGTALWRTVFPPCHILAIFS